MFRGYSSIMNVTDKQKQILLKYMLENKDFATGRLRYNSENKRILDDMWFTVTNSLNAAGNGPHKQPKEWQKTWRDWKSNVLKKCAKNKSYAHGTGGGPPKIINLTHIEEQLLEIISPEAAGLENIPEGGFGTLPIPGTSQKIAKKAETPTIYNKKIRTPLAETSTSLNADELSFVDIDYLYEMNSTSQEVANMETCDDDIEDIIIHTTTQNTVNSSDRGNKRPRRNSASTAVDLMREKMDLLRVQIKSNKKFQERMIQIEEEKLKIAIENVDLKRQMVSSVQSLCLEVREVLNNVSENVTQIRIDVEKIAPSYLE